MPTIGRNEIVTISHPLRKDNLGGIKPPWEVSKQSGFNMLSAKIDTGALSNSIRAEEIKYMDGNEVKYIAYRLGGVWSPWIEINQECKTVKSSCGCNDERPVVWCQLSMGIGENKLTENYVEFTITQNSGMTSAILIGRKTIKRFKALVDCRAKYMLGRPGD
tara:strand:+ start:65 stop:550 length:486 start_codon:yes stop_codon:yes gene_type:complete